MKNIVAASALLALFAGVASASGAQNHERPDVAPKAAVVAQDVQQVAAKSLYSPKELTRLNLTASESVDVTVFDTKTVKEVGGNR
jgi:hypothetical protein